LDLSLVTGSTLESGAAGLRPSLHKELCGAYEEISADFSSREAPSGWRCRALGTNREFTTYASAFSAATSDRFRECEVTRMLRVPVQARFVVFDSDEEAVLSFLDRRDKEVVEEGQSEVIKGLIFERLDQAELFLEPFTLRLTFGE